MLGRTPGSMISIRPLKDGVIADFEATEMLLNIFSNSAIYKVGFEKYYPDLSSRRILQQ